MTTSAPRTESPATFCSLRRAGRTGACRPGNMHVWSATGFAASVSILHIRHPFAAPDQGDADLPAHRESSRGPAIIGPFQDRKHSALPRHRGRRRPGNCRANRRVTRPGGAGPLCPPRRTEDVEIRWWSRFEISQFVLPRTAQSCRSPPTLKVILQASSSDGGCARQIFLRVIFYCHDGACDLAMSQLRGGHDDRKIPHRALKKKGRWCVI